MRAACLLMALVVVGMTCAQQAYDPALIRSIASSEAPRAPRIPEKSNQGPSRGYDLRYHRLDLAVDPAIRAINGSVTHYFTALVALQDIVLDLSNDLAVSMILYHGQGIGSTHGSDLLMVTLPSPIAAGTLDSITISYAGIPPDTGFGSFVQDEHDGQPIIWTLSEPYGARDWWPCKQDLNDKADSLDLLVRAPMGNRVAGNGVLVEELDLGDGTVRHHWRHRHPIAHYLIAFAVTNYEAYTDTAPLPEGDVEVLNYVFPEHLADWQSASPQVVGQIQLYSDLFGAYPFLDEKYGHAEFSWGGGMEHQTMSFMGSNHYELLSHELAHQWFGDLVTCGSWQDLWLNEGFASYLSGLCYEFLAPEYWMPFKQGRRDFITSQPGGSVLVTDTNDLARLFDSRLTYAKGAFVLHMLRWVCGDEAFFQGINAYLDDPALRNGSAVTEELIAHLEGASGLDLTEFMQDWYSGEGFPTYQLIWAQDMGGTVTVELHQTTSHASVDFFEMPVPVRFTNGSEEQTVILNHAFSGQVFSFDLPFQAGTALLDPEIWILSGQNLVLQVPAGAFGNQGLLLYPNPVSEQAWLYTGTALQGQALIEVLDATGRVVRNASRVVDEQRIALPVEGLSAGSYLLRVRNGERQLESRFVKR